MPYKSDFISHDDLPEVKNLLSRWISLMNEVRVEILRVSPSLEKAEVHKTMRQRIVAEIGMAQFFTFSSIAILVSHWHFHDAFTLLRTLYEGHLHLWNLSSCSEDELNRYAQIQAIHEWDVATQLLPNKNLQDIYYNAERIDNLKSDYENAIQFFDCRPGKIPRNYTTKSVLDIAKELDLIEGHKPYREIMHTRLYSTGSEYVHRTLYSIREGLAVQPSEERYVLSQNPKRGIEASWWASSIEIDCLEWQSQSQDFEEGKVVAFSLRQKVSDLAKEWLLDN